MAQRGVGAMNDTDKQGSICQISLGGSKFWLLKSTTVLMHRYIEIWKPTKSSLKVIMYTL